tara:strand:- start:124 stop:438 length:315 start_codon:yes stop_codon:yes gene_type:complete
MNIKVLKLHVMENQFLIIPKSEFEELKSQLRTRDEKLLEAIQGSGSLNRATEYLTVKEFMAHVKIARSKFDELVADGKVKTVRPNGGRKIYIPAEEVSRFFEGE